MEYREHRGLTLSAVGLGAYALAGAYGACDRDEFVALVRHARARGVTFFDTAGNYGDAEAVLGAAVRPFREEVLLATKVGSPEGALPRLDPEAVAASCHRSLARLGTDYLDLLQVHFDDPATPVEDTVAALERLRAEGLIRHYGVGHLPAHRVKQYLEVGEPFSLLMELSAVARDSRRSLLPLCGGAGPVAIGFSVTGRGLLTGKIGPGTVFEEGDIRRYDPLFQRARFASGQRIAARFATLARSLGKTPAQVAVAWLLAQPGVVCALTGPRRLAHLEENLGGVGWRLPAEALAGLEGLFAAEDEALAAEEAATIDAILDGPLPAEPAAAFRDLVYAVETAVNLRRVAEDAIRPAFFALWPLQEQLEGAGPALEAARTRLRGVIPPAS
ncbi:MAG: aldo/keto reductase [Acidimicrobiia bacterium]|nr:aldo/keto reductase [Acidimicrobiia bacterium]